MLGSDWAVTGPGTDNTRPGGRSSRVGPGAAVTSEDLGHCGEGRDRGRVGRGGVLGCQKLGLNLQDGGSH